MKKCPTCDKTFDDGMRFCQADGTPLVDVVETPDPFKTMVASKDEIAAALGSSESGKAGDTSRASDDVLEIPAAAPSQGFASEGEVMEIPPLTGGSASLQDDRPEAPAEDVASTGDAELEAEEETIYQQSAPPIPSPFSVPEPVSTESAGRDLSEAETRISQPPAFDPFEKAVPPPAPVEWTPPPAPEASWQNQGVGQNTPFQPPPVGAGGENKTLPIVSLVFGILSLCCWVAPLTGIVALVTGFLGIKNANSNPSEFGGKTLAIVGMILGGLFLVLGLIYWIVSFFLGGLSAVMNSVAQ
ncbi:MAG: DUF4190 domain-containing protein [Pyrinomonadaceae bacterium]